MRAAPRRATGCRSGPRCSNVRVYVVDEHLDPVPLGAPGLIVLLRRLRGPRLRQRPRAHRAPPTCSDPHRPGERLYLGGRLRPLAPDGKLEFLGRRDSQVKISGLPHRDRRDRQRPAARCPVCATAPWSWPSGPTAASTSWPSTPGRPADRRSRCCASGWAPRCPTTWCPAAFHRRDALPLTAERQDRHEGVDGAGRRARRRRGERGGAAAPRRPSSGWRPRARRARRRRSTRSGARDHFFDRGGTSLTAVKLAIALKRAVSLKDITRLPGAGRPGRADRRSGARAARRGRRLAEVRAGLLRCRGTEGPGA